MKVGNDFEIHLLLYEYCCCARNSFMSHIKTIVWRVQPDSVPRRSLTRCVFWFDILSCLWKSSLNPNFTLDIDRISTPKHNGGVNECRRCTLQWKVFVFMATTWGTKMFRSTRLFIDRAPCLVRQTLTDVVIRSGKFATLWSPRRMDAIVCVKVI